MSILTSVLLAMSWCSGISLLMITVLARKKIPWQRIFTRVSLAIFVIFSSTCRSLVFDPVRSKPPGWYTPAVDGFLIVLCISLLVLAIKDSEPKP
jgi:hypothetical protein